MAMKRCTRCILPENYPGITFDEEGICNYCLTHKERSYLGGEALRERIKSFLETREGRNEDYDCVLALGGGRDSSYLLYYLVRALNLRVLAYSVDNYFIPDQTRRNMERAANILDVRLVIEECDYLRKCVKHHMLSWLRRPSPAMVGMLCTGCRLGMVTKIPNFARTNKVPVIINGSTPQDIGSFKRRIMSIGDSSRQPYTLALGYLSQVLVNPRWVLNPTCLITQGREYHHRFLARKRRYRDLLRLRPFLTYIHWEEREVVHTIENELEWRRHPGMDSTWRGDCDIAMVKSYLYKKTLGYNDKVEGLSYLVRDGQITRRKALERLAEEAEVSQQVIREFFEKLGLSFSGLETALRPFTGTWE